MKEKEREGGREITCAPKKLPNHIEGPTRKPKPCRQSWRVLQALLSSLASEDQSVTHRGSSDCEPTHSLWPEESQSTYVKCLEFLLQRTDSGLAI